MRMIRLILRTFRKLRTAALVGLVGASLTLAVCALFVIRPNLMVYMEYKLYDILLQRTHHNATSGVPIVVDLDEATLQEYGQWPWPRYRVALLLARLKESGVRAVGLDVVFAEPDRTSPDVLLRELKRDLRVEARIQGLPPQLMDNDAVLANVLQAGPYVLGRHFFTADRALDKQSDKNVQRPTHTLPHAFLFLPDVDQRHSLARIANASAATLNHKRLREAATAAGFFTTSMDWDGILRRTPLFMRHGGELYPSLALATLARAHGEALPTALIHMDENGVFAMEFKGLRIPLDASGNLLLKFRGPRRTFRYVSAGDVLAQRYADGGLEGKIALVGSSASGLMDLRSTPLDPVYPGVETHATIIDMLLQRDFIARPSWAWGGELLATAAVGFVFTVLLAVTRARFALALALGSGYAMWRGAVWCMEQGWHVSPLFPMLVLGLVFLGLTMMRFWREETQKRFFKTAFSSYVAPAVVEQLAEAPERLSLTGEEKQISILFTDLRGFTSLSETLTPQQLSALLHAYFTPMTEIITQRMGTVDKFIGDAIMAFWNAPLDVSDHQCRAVEAAVAMAHALKTLNPSLQREYGVTLRIGAGVHCDTVRVGNMGSNNLFNYTIIGDGVNLTSRLEGLTKFYGVTILMSEHVAACAHGHVASFEVDTVRVKGKAQSVTIFAPRLDESDEEVNDHKEALEMYKQHAFERALTRFTRLQESTGRRLYTVYAERCRYLRANPPQEGWDSVFSHESK